MTNVTNDFSRPIAVADGGTGGTTPLSARTNLGITIGARDIDGTPDQIGVTNPDGALGNPTIAIATDPVLPGSGAVTTPRGQTVERHPTPLEGMIRGNTDTGFTEVYSDGAWRILGREIEGTLNQIDVVDGDAIAGNPIISISDDPILPGTGAFIPPVGTTAQRPGSPSIGMIRANSDSGFAEYYSSTGWVQCNMTVPYGYISGLEHTITSASIVTFSAGQASDLTNAYIANSVSPFSKDISAVWAAGTGNGGRASAVALAADTFYYTFVIIKDNGVIDFGFDTDITAANLLADAAGDDFVAYRRIGAVTTETGTTDLEVMYQMGDYFYYETIRTDYSLISPALSTVNAITAMSIPPAINVQAKILFTGYRSTINAQLTRGGVYPITTTGVGTNAITMVQQVSSNAVSGSVVTEVPSTDGTVRVYIDITGAANIGWFYATTMGWIDSRGM